MALIVLDTNACPAIKRGNAEVASIVRDAAEVALPAVVVGELFYGFRRGSRFAKNLQELKAFLARPRVRFLPVPFVAADRYGRIAAQLRDKDRPIPSNDIRIAAQTMECGGALISADAHFGNIHGLAWTRTA